MFKMLFIKCVWVKKKKKDFYTIKILKTHALSTETKMSNLNAKKEKVIIIIKFFFLPASCKSSSRYFPLLISTDKIK